MKPLKILSCLAVLALLIMSCRKEAPLIPEENIETGGRINFSALAIGQKSHYVLFRGENIRDNNNNNFEYLEDTLSVEIVSEDENGWLVKERLTPYSRSLNGENNVAFADSTWYYYLQVEEDMLKIKQRGNYYRTRLFFLGEETDRGLNLQAIASPRIEINGWKTSLPFAEEFTAAMVQDYKQFNQEFGALNVIIDNRPMQESLPGKTHIFSKEEGLVRSAEYSDYDGKGYGWDAL